uniref:Uncharacterized protein n=1 Tax=Rhizophora mucronata TaxID=61149 RepID=A0A2P2PGP2_RHIMU
MLDINISFSTFVHYKLMHCTVT